jgi:hypothetical protein
MDAISGKHDRCQKGPHQALGCSQCFGIVGEGPGKVILAIEPFLAADLVFYVGQIFAVRKSPHAWRDVGSVFELPGCCQFLTSLTVAGRIKQFDAAAANQFLKVTKFSK